jgi:hypothetical protein
MPDQTRTDAFLDSLWPLSRFVGYRPPPPSPGAAVSRTRYLDHILPAPLRERHRRKREGEVELQSGRTSREVGRDASEERGEGQHRKNPGDGAGADRDHPSKLGKLKHKLWDVLLTLIGSFFGTAFLALGLSFSFSSCSRPLTFLSSSLSRLLPHQALGTYRHRLLWR